MSESPDQARDYNTRLGLVLFAIYLALYAGFVLTNTFAASTMDTIVLAGLNLAIVYGFGLIIAAFVMAMAYGMMCKAEPTAETVSTETTTESGDQA